MPGSPHRGSLILPAALLRAQDDDSSDNDISGAGAPSGDRVATLTREIAANPENGLFYRQRGYQYLSANQFDEAIADLDRAIELNPDDPNGYRLRGFCYLRKHNLDSAIADYSETIWLNPQAAIAYARRAQAYALEGDTARAKSDLDQAAQIAPAEPASLLTDVVAAMTWRILRDWPQSRACLETATRVAPSSAPAFNRLAWLLATCPEDDMRDGRMAIQDATTACNLTQWRGAPMIDTLAAACAEAGDFNSAVKWENQFLQMAGPSSPAAAHWQSRLALYEDHRPYHEDD